MLTTQTGVGTFTSASTNRGSFSDAVANDGVATYTFHMLDAGVARFFLNYSGGAAGAAGSTVDIDAYQSNYPAMRDDDSEGILRFAPSGVIITSRALPNPPPNQISDPIGSQTAGADFQLNLAAYGTAPSDPECGVIESYAGDKPVRFWIEYGEPGVAPLVPTIDGTAIAVSEAGAASRTVRFSRGQAVVTARYRDVGRITALDSSGTTSVCGATGSFVSRPADLAIVAVTNAQGDSNPGLSTPTGVPFARAGEPFLVRVEARAANGKRTPSYGREAVPERIRLRSSTPVAPFDAELELSIDILDADATAYPANPFRIGGTAAGAGIAFDTSKRFQFGRLRLDNAYGSELVSLPMRLRVQRFNGTAFDDDDSESCSRVPASALVRTPSPAALATAPTLDHIPLFSGDAGLTWSAPTDPGHVDVRVDLGSTGANLPWLRADWPEDGNLDGIHDDHPRARATFGIWEGRDALIFVRELYSAESPIRPCAAALGATPPVP